MSTQTEAMKLAIEVFDGNWHDEIVDTDWADKANNAITALRKALAEQPAPVQRPDAIGCKCSECGKWQRWTPSGMTCKNGHGGAPGINHRLYTTPPAQAQPAREWVGLTAEQISSIWDGHVVPVFGKNGINPIVFAKAIEAKLKEKNTK